MKNLLIIMALVLVASCAPKCRLGKQDSLKYHQKIQKEKAFKGYKMSKKELKGAGLK